jgi:hypothetical protein
MHETTASGLVVARSIRDRPPDSDSGRLTRREKCRDQIGRAQGLPDGELLRKAAHVVSGLVKRRAALAGDIENSHAALRRMVLDLENLDDTRQFGWWAPLNKAVFIGSLKHKSMQY